MAAIIRTSDFIVFEPLAVDGVGEPGAGLISSGIHRPDVNIGPLFLAAVQGEKAKIDLLVLEIPRMSRKKVIPHNHPGIHVLFRKPVDHKAGSPRGNIVVSGKDFHRRRQGIDNNLFLKKGGVALQPPPHGTVPDADAEHRLPIGNAEFLGRTGS